MTDYIQKALESSYEEYVEYLVVCVEEKIDRDKMGLKEATEDIVSEAFEQLRSDKSVLDRFIAEANELYDEPFEDDTSLEQQTVDAVIQEINDMELYMAKKTDTLPDSKRLKY